MEMQRTLPSVCKAVCVVRECVAVCHVLTILSASSVRISISLESFLAQAQAGTMAQRRLQLLPTAQAQTEQIEGVSLSLFCVIYQVLHCAQRFCALYQDDVMHTFSIQQHRRLTLRSNAVNCIYFYSSVWIVDVRGVMMHSYFPFRVISNATIMPSRKPSIMVCSFGGAQFFQGQCPHSLRCLAQRTRQGIDSSTLCSRLCPMLCFAVCVSYLAASQLS